MEFFETRTSDGLRLIGLISRAKQERYLIVHVHGYGGDFFSNTLVRSAHDYYPKHGISFLSFNLRTATYLSEVYSEKSVVYVGSSLTNQDAVEADIDAVMADCHTAPDRIILQGHSFGTNIVKRYARLHSTPSRIILLSPADSMALYHQWRQSQPRVSKEPSTNDAVIRWDLFGMAAGAASYPLPITYPCMNDLLRSDSFNEWSNDAIATQDALVVIGSSDPISNLGTTSDNAFLKRVMPQCYVKRIDGSQHLFTGFEAELCQTVTSWILG